jgi:hypothetical protein
MSDTPIGCTCGWVGKGEHVCFKPTKGLFCAHWCVECLRAGKKEYAETILRGNSLCLEHCVNHNKIEFPFKMAVSDGND